MSPSIKPEVCIIDGRLNIFLGADYKAMPLDVADRFVRRCQGELARLRRQEKRKRRAATEGRVEAQAMGDA